MRLICSLQCWLRFTKLLAVTSLRALSSTFLSDRCAPFNSQGFFRVWSYIKYAGSRWICAMLKNPICAAKLLNECQREHYFVFHAPNAALGRKNREAGCTVLKFL